MELIVYLVCRIVDAYTFKESIALHFNVNIISNIYINPKKYIYTTLQLPADIPIPFVGICHRQKSNNPHLGNIVL